MVSRISNKGLKLVGMMSLLIGSGCTGETSPEAVSFSRGGHNQPPVITMSKIVGDSLSLAAPVRVQVDASDPERETVTFQYQWFIDGTPVTGQTNPMLPSEGLRRGQWVSVEIVPADGTQKGAAVRVPAVVVGNTAPNIESVILTPEEAQPGKRLMAEVMANDVDHDRVDLTYRWFRNDTVVKEGEEAFFDTQGLAPRDQVIVEVTARDPEAIGNRLRSNPVVLGNSAPTIISNPPAPVTPDHYEYAVKAVDSDGDSLTYSLETAPSGMTIEESSGRITWVIPQSNRGVYHVKVIAKDGRGGNAYQEFDLTVGVSSVPSAAGA